MGCARRADPSAARAPRPRDARAPRPCAAPARRPRAARSRATPAPALPSPPHLTAVRNDAPSTTRVFIDLDESWSKNCDNCAAQDDKECPFLTQYSGLSLDDCQSRCVSNTECNTINYSGNTTGGFTTDCELRACTDPVPSESEDPTYSSYTYNRGDVYTYDATLGTNPWSSALITASACPSGSPPLVPRSSGYTVGTVRSTDATTDRLIILGGDQAEANVYYSDDCGVTWACYDGTNAFSARQFAPIVHELGVVGGDPVYLLGGASFATPDDDQPIPSIGIFQNDFDGLSGWHRPDCTDQVACGASYCDPDGTDAVCTPDSPTYPGQVAFDWTSLTIFYPDPFGSVQQLSGANPGAGFAPVAGATADGRLGRNVFIRGKAPGSGCWFSTDWVADDVWVTDVFDSVVASSTNAFATARTAAGPWQAGVAPWAPRVGAAVVASPSRSLAYVAAGLDFACDAGGDNCAPTGLTFGDVWSVDASVCLRAGSGEVCNGHGVADLDNVVCICDPGYAASDRCDLGSATVTATVSPSPTPSPLSASATPTATPTPPATPAAASASASLSPTPRATPTRSHSRSPSPAAPGSGAGAAAAAGLSPGAAAGVSFAVIGAGLAGGLFVFARFFGGGPALAALADSVGKGLGGGARGERASLLRVAAPRGAMSQNAAAERFRASDAAASSAI